MRNIFCITAGLFLFSVVCGQQPVIIDHTTTNLSVVPVGFINQAKSNLKIWYGHTSHGSQITTGIDNLQTHIGDPYTFNEGGTGGALSYQEEWSIDLGHNGDTAWAQRTREILNAPGNDRNVIIWSWCGGVSDNTEEGITIYLNKMTELENDYPGVQFVYMTGHLDIWAWANLKARNQQIRDYCVANNKILFDFADIESYNPDLLFFEYADDGCNYYTGPGGTLLGNWAIEWCSANPLSDLCWSCSCAHSEALNCNVKGRSFWWMMARMAGWDGAVGVENQSHHSGFRCFAANETIYISLSLEQNIELTCRVHDISGRMIASFRHVYSPDQQLIEVPADELKQGAYIVRVIGDNGMEWITKMMVE